MDFFDLPLSDTQTEWFTEAEVAAFGLRSGWVDDIAVITPGRTVIESRPLSWWPAHRLIIARDPQWGAHLAAWVLPDAGRLVRLNGQSPPIHGINSRVKPSLSADNTLAYLGFFCTFVHGNSGPFAIVRSVTDGILPPSLDRSKIAGHLRDAVLLKQDPAAADEAGPSYHVEAMVYFGDGLFLSNFVVRPTGMVEMVEDDMVVSDLGAVIEMPLVFEAPDAAAAGASAADRAPG